MKKEKMLVELDYVWMIFMDNIKMCTKEKGPNLW